MDRLVPLISKIEESDSYEYSFSFLRCFQGSNVCLKFLYKIDSSDTCPLKANPYNLGPMLEEIVARQIMDAGFQVRCESEYVSRAVVLAKLGKGDDPRVDTL